MTFVPYTAATTAAAAAAAAQERQRLDQEEELMTPYNGEDLEGWEFKIVRASTRKFRDPEIVRQLCDEESKAGWEMLEKFDDSRIRFKRRIEARSGDQHREIDPYRTLIGMSGTMREWCIAGAVMGVLAVVALIVILLKFLLS
jgi:hypothetical protein